MKKYNVKVTRYFTDKYTGKERNVGDTFICDEERYNFLKDNNAVELVEIIEEKPQVVLNTEIKINDETIKENIVKSKKTTKKKNK